MPLFVGLIDIVELHYMTDSYIQSIPFQQQHGVLGDLSAEHLAKFQYKNPPTYPWVVWGEGVVEMIVTV